MGVVESQLLFRPGEVFSPELVEESARLLRRHDYLYDVAIQPVLRGDGKVDVEVTTRDVSTLQGGASFGRAGGRNSTSFSLDDWNSWAPARRSRWPGSAPSTAPPTWCASPIPT